MISPDPETSLPLNLPDEVWGKVFSYLCLDDRKSIRLSCCRFYGISSNANFQKTEWMVFNGDLNADAALRYFSSCQGRNVWNLEMNLVHLTDDSILLFCQRQAAKIRSLVFHDCLIAPGLLKNIIEYCENLASFTLSFSSIYFARGDIWRQLAIIFSEFKSLHDTGIIRPSVTNFTFRLMHRRGRPNPILTNKKFLLFFAIFPNIKKLDLALFMDFSNTGFTQFSTILSDITSDTEFSFSCIYYQLFQLRDQLEELEIFFPDYYRESVHSIQTWNKICDIEMKNLKWLSLNYKLYGILSGINTISHFQYVTEFVFTYDVPTNTAPDIQLILNNAKQLHSLIIHCPCFEVFLDRDCMKALIQSQLEKLSIFGMFRTDFVCLENGISNCNLKDLDLMIFDHNLILLFTAHFRFLDKLYIQEFDERYLENIFKYQKKLRTLKFYNVRSPHSCNDYSSRQTSSVSLYRWLKNQSQFNRQLDYLVHLEILEADDFDFTEFLLNQFMFPKLKSLVIRLISLYPRSITNRLWQIFQKFTDLEFLMIDGEIEIPFFQWLSLCRTLLKLRYIFIQHNKFLLYDDSEYRQLFEISSSLRIIFHGKFKSLTSIKYFKDTITNTVKKKFLPRGCRTLYESVNEGIPLKYISPAFNHIGTE